METLGALKAGDICWQFAQKAHLEMGEEIPPDKIKLVVSDQHGILSKIVIFSKALFKEQFTADPDKPNLFFRQVQIEEIDEQTIYFCRLNSHNQAVGAAQRIKRDLFEDTYFIPSHQMGDV